MKTGELKKRLGRGFCAGLALMLSVSALPAGMVSAEETETTTEEQTSEEAGTDTAEESTSGDSEEKQDEGTGAGGEKPDGDPGEKPDGEKPDGDPGEKPDGEKPDGDPGEKPDGEKPDGDPGEKPDGDPGEKPDGDPGEKPDGQPGGEPGGQSGVEDYTALQEYEEDATLEGETISSTGTDENAVLNSGTGTVSLNNCTVDRTSEDSTGGDNSSFYGVGAAILGIAGKVIVNNSVITTDAKGGAGVFSYGDSVAYVADTEITTQQDTSGGVHVAGGGTLYAWDLTVETNGESSAAIRSDRGGGTMVVDGGTYTSKGTGSPAVYTTADISIHNATLTSENSEAICIEGKNSLRLFDCDLSGNIPTNEQNDCDWNVILYQSMSGDSEEGNSLFEMYGGTLTAQNGGMFYTTNTESTFVLSDVDITYAEDSEFFLKCTGNSNQRGWGETGSNGADCTFTGRAQEMEGNVIWDSISDLDFYMIEESSLTGAFVDDESCAGEGGDGVCSVYIDVSSTWTVTGDSTVTNLYCAGTITDEEGNIVTVQGTDGTVYVEGNSEYTITVENYEDTVDLSGASTLEQWSDFEVEKPEELQV